MSVLMWPYSTYMLDVVTTLPVTVYTYRDISVYRSVQCCILPMAVYGHVDILLCSLGLAPCLRLVQEIPYSSVASRALADLQKGSTNEITYRDRDGHDRPKG